MMSTKIKWIIRNDLHYVTNSREQIEICDTWRGGFPRIAGLNCWCFVESHVHVTWAIFTLLAELFSLIVHENKIATKKPDWEIQPLGNYADTWPLSKRFLCKENLKLNIVGNSKQRLRCRQNKRLLELFSRPATRLTLRSEPLIDPCSSSHPWCTTCYISHLSWTHVVSDSDNK